MVVPIRSGVTRTARNGENQALCARSTRRWTHSRALSSFCAAQSRLTGVVLFRRRKESRTQTVRHVGWRCRRTCPMHRMALSPNLSEESDTSDVSDIEPALGPPISCFSALHGAGTAIAVLALMQSTAATVFELPGSVAITAQRWQRMTDGSALWSGLVEGAWSVVSEFECDACLYLVVRGNDRETRAARALAEREQEVLARIVLGQANKFVSYELCMAQSCVSICIKEACAKLGVRSRTPLLQLMQFGMGSTEPHSERFLLRENESVLLRLERQEVLTPTALTSSERAIFLSILRGLTNAEIAARRKRSLRTVANQIASLFRKLAVSSRAELAARYGSLAGVSVQQIESTLKSTLAVKAADCPAPRPSAPQAPSRIAGAPSDRGRAGHSFTFDRRPNAARLAGAERSF